MLMYALKAYFFKVVSGSRSTGVVGDFISRESKYSFSVFVIFISF